MVLILVFKRYIFEKDMEGGATEWEKSNRREGVKY